MQIIPDIHCAQSIEDGDDDKDDESKLSPQEIQAKQELRKQKRLLRAIKRSKVEL
jgi:hypothetical protein